MSLTRRTADERGSILVFTTLVFVVVAGIASLVVDMGLARSLQAQAQAGTDAAVLAALPLAHDGEMEEALLLARMYAESNGFDPEQVFVNSPPAYGPFAGIARCVEVEIHGETTALFSSLIGRSKLDSAARTVGCVQPPHPEVPALYAEGEDCGNQSLQVGGNDAMIIGGAHSNDELHVSGNNHEFWGRVVSSNNGMHVGGGDILFAEGVDPDAPYMYPPLEWDIEDFEPGGKYALEAAARGEYHFAGWDTINNKWVRDNTSSGDPDVLDPGIYFTYDDIKLTGSLRVLDDGAVTLVAANGILNLSGSDQVLKPYVDQLLAFGNRDGGCNTTAVDITGSDVSWEGVIYAPRAAAKVAGSGISALDGAILALGTDVSGQGFTVDSSDLQPGPSGPPKLWE